MALCLLALVMSLVIFGDVFGGFHDFYAIFCFTKRSTVFERDQRILPRNAQAACLRPSDEERSKQGLG